MGAFSTPHRGSVLPRRSGATALTGCRSGRNPEQQGDTPCGPRTQAALKRYQEAERLEATGELNRDTLVRLGVRDPTPEHVREVQQALSKTGFDPGPADGRLGARTKAALRRYVAAPAPRGQGPAYDTIERFMRETGQLQSP